MITNITRRLFFKLSVFTGFVLSIGAFFTRKPAEAYIRPPGAIEDGKFQGRCIRCFVCGEVCPNKAIKFLGLEAGLTELGTPYVKPREQGCMLCMKCTEVCPTGALEKIEDDTDQILDKARMGKAVVDEDLCYSYNNRVCGFCWGACPFPDVALKLEMWAQPVVTDKCVGCGLCEKICVQVPQAIRIEAGEVEDVTDV